LTLTAFEILPRCRNQFFYYSGTPLLVRFRPRISKARYYNDDYFKMLSHYKKGIAGISNMIKFSEKPAQAIRR
jgi:hypothetical protein